MAGYFNTVAKPAAQQLTPEQLQQIGQSNYDKIATNNGIIGAVLPDNYQLPTPSADWFSQFQGGVTGQPTATVDPSMPNANQWDQSTFTQQFGTPGTPEELAALEPKLNAAGIRVSRNAAGVAGKIILPNGQYVDVINSAGVGGKGFQWLTGEDSKPGAPSNAPYNFATDDPSYQWRLQQGLEGVQKSAAANGTLLTGGTLKDLVNYGQGAASQEYGAAFGRKQNLAQLGLQAAGAAANTGSAYGANIANLTTAQGNANAQNSLYQGGNNANTIASLFKAGTDLYGKYKTGSSGYPGTPPYVGYPPNDTNGWG